MLYTVPAGKSAIISFCSIVAKTSLSKFTLSIVPSGDILQDKNIVSQGLIEPNRDRLKLQSVTLQAGDKVYCNANTAANLSFGLFGDEIS